MPTTRISNAGVLSDTTTVQNHGASLTAGSSVSSFMYPWHRRISNDLVLTDASRPAANTTRADTGTRLSHDAALIRS